jgi:ketosteroid isomerase-like protein
MNVRIRGLLLALALAALGNAAAAAESAAEREILALEQSFNDAYGANDLPKYFGYYADDLVAIFPAGRTDLATYRREWTAAVAAGDRLVWSRPSDMHVRMSPAGDTAIASYLLDVRTRLHDGNFTEEHFQETDVWLRRNGYWQVAHIHYSVAPLAASR